MSIHEDPKEALHALWDKQFSDERLYAYFVRMQNKFVSKARELEEMKPLADGIKSLLMQLYEGRRLLEAMHLHIKTHNEKQGYALREISGFRYVLNPGLLIISHHSASVDKFPLGIKSKPGGNIEVVENAKASADSQAVIDRHPEHPYILQLSSPHNFWVYLNGCWLNLHDSPQDLGTYAHIQIEETSLIINWIERFLHHRATGRVIKHGLFCST